MQAKVIISFENLSEPDFLARVETIGTSVTNNANFPEPWPAAVPPPAEISADVAAFKIAYQEAANGDRAKIKVRNDKRAALSAKLKKVGAYLEIVADGNVSVLSTSGFELRQDIVKSASKDPPPAPQDLKVNRGSLSGVLLIHARALPSVDVYDVQVATADPSVEASWSDAGTHTHCNRIEITGLTPGKTYYVRLRGFNKNGHGVWATSSGIPVL